MTLHLHSSKMRSRAWFEKHGYQRQVRLYGLNGGLFSATFPKTKPEQDRAVARWKKLGRYTENTKSKRITLIVVWAPEGDEMIELS